MSLENNNPARRAENPHEELFKKSISGLVETGMDTYNGVNLAEVLYLRLVKEFTFQEVADKVNSKLEFVRQLQEIALRRLEKAGKISSIEGQNIRIFLRHQKRSKLWQDSLYSPTDFKNYIKANK